MKTKLTKIKKIALVKEFYLCLFDEAYQKKIKSVPVFTI